MKSYKLLLSTVLDEHNPNEAINTYRDIFNVVRRYQFETSTIRKLSVIPSVPILPSQHQQSYLRLNTK